MSPFLLRQLWSVVDSTQNSVILSLDDQGLVSWLMDQLTRQSPLDSRELSQVSHYIQMKLPLIRDMAQGR